MKTQTFGCFLLLALGCLAPGRVSAQEAEVPDPSVTEAITKVLTNKVAEEVVTPRRHGKSARPQELVAIGQEVAVKEGEERTDVVVVGGKAIVDGTVQDLVSVFGSVKLGPTAVVKGDLVMVGGAADIDPAATVRGQRIAIGAMTNLQNVWWLKVPQQWLAKGLFWARPMPHQFVWSWLLAGILLLVLLVLALLFPKPVDACVQSLQERPGSSLLVGFLALVFFGPLVVLCVVTVVGILVVPLLALGLAMAYLLGKVAVYRYAGQQLESQFGLRAAQHPLVAFLIGAALFYLLYLVPVVGLMAWGVATLLAVGAASLAFFSSFRSENGRSNGSAGVAGGIAAPGAVPPLAGAPADLTLAPRVGFWARFFATLLDLLLVGGLLGVLRPIYRHAGPGVFMLAWLAYHIGLWAWKGTTIGGLVLGLKIIRQDGRPVDLAVAVVRALGAFLSFMALCLGFFWAGWDRERQSWHDKIAGTLIVRPPKGTSLI